MTPKARFIATLAAAATALGLLTATAVPAKADSDRLAKFLFGAAAIALIAKAIDDSHKPKAVPVTPDPVRPHPPVVVAPPLPGVCAMPISGFAGETRGYGERCLINRGHLTGRGQGRGRVQGLPQHCARAARIDGRADRIYGENCLARAGYRFAR